MKKHKRFGFTLIEVLIALVILAIALTAVIVAVTNSVSNVDRLREKLAAHWLAMNIVAELDASYLKLSLDDDDSIGGHQIVLGKNYYWRFARVNNNQGGTSYQQIYVEVSPLPNFSPLIDKVYAFVPAPSQTKTTKKTDNNDESSS